MPPTPPDSAIVDIGTTAGSGIGGIIIGVAAKVWHSRKAVASHIKRIESKIDDIQTERAASAQEFASHRAEIWKAISDINSTVGKIDAKLDTTAETLQFIRGMLNGKANHG